MSRAPVVLKLTVDPDRLAVVSPELAFAILTNPVTESATMFDDAVLSVRMFPMPVPAIRLIEATETTTVEAEALIDPPETSSRSETDGSVAFAKTVMDPEFGEPMASEDAEMDANSEDERPRDKVPVSLSADPMPMGRLAERGEMETMPPADAI